MLKFLFRHRLNHSGVSLVNSCAEAYEAWKKKCLTKKKKISTEFELFVANGNYQIYFLLIDVLKECSVHRQVCIRFNSIRAEQSNECNSIRARTFTIINPSSLVFHRTAMARCTYILFIGDQIGGAPGYMTKIA